MNVDSLTAPCVTRENGATCAYVRSRRRWGPPCALLVALLGPSASAKAAATVDAPTSLVARALRASGLAVNPSLSRRLAWSRWLPQLALRGSLLAADVPGLRGSSLEAFASLCWPLGSSSSAIQLLASRRLGAERRRELIDDVADRWQAWQRARARLQRAPRGDIGARLDFESAQARLEALTGVEGAIGR